jgi:hypothetical protein
MRLSSRFERFRPWIAKFRYFSWSLLGLNHFMRSPSLEAGGAPQAAIAGQMHMLTDRLAILESIVNWRLYGLPARVENIKLEEARILAGSGEVEDSLAFLAEHDAVVITDPVLSAVLAAAPAQVASFFGVGFSAHSECQLLVQLAGRAQRSWIVDDPTNLLRSKEIPESLRQAASVVEVSVLDAMPLIEKVNFDVLYFSDALNRLTPIQQVILLRKVCECLRPSSVALFVVHEFSSESASQYWIDPRRLRPLNLAAVRSMLPAEFKGTIEVCASSKDCTLAAIKL